MGQAAVLVRDPAPQDVRRDQPEYSAPLEAQRATSSSTRLEDLALARRHDTAKRAHHADDRRPVFQRSDDQRLGALARRRGIRRPSLRYLGQATLAWHALELQKPAKCVKELHSPEQQHASTHRLFVKLCWLMDKHAVSADRVVNIDETSTGSCRCIRSGGAAAASNSPAAWQH